MKIRFEKLEIEIGDDFVEAVVDGFATLKNLDAEHILRSRRIENDAARSRQNEKLTALSQLIPSLVTLIRETFNPPRPEPKPSEPEGPDQPSDQQPQG